MDFDLSEEQQAFQATARDFARAEMMPHAREGDEEEIFPVGTLRRAAALGFGGLHVSAESAARRSRGLMPPSSSRSWRRAACRLDPQHGGLDDRHIRQLRTAP